VPALEALVAAHRAAHPADQAIRAIIVTNPSNPCGSNFTAQHVIDIAAATARMQVPIIADEIYAGMTFAGAKFVSFTNQTLSPALVAGGLAKQWVAPGWRLGWLLRHDPSEGKTLLANVWRGVVDVSAILIGPNALIQGALPTILAPGPEGAAHRRELNATLEAQAALCYEALVATKSLKPTKPQGAMYMLVRIPDVASIRPEFNIKDDVDFSARLMEAENVQVLPGTIFGIPGFVRIVFTKPPAQLREAVARMAAFADMITA
jgi:tyrosine aminotransferase